MAQRLHKFKAESLDLAYRAMRSRLGDDAIILRTTTVTEGGLFGLMGRKLVELTASSPESQNGPRKRSSAERKYMASSRPAGRAASDPAKMEQYKELIRDAQRRMGTAEPADEFARTSVMTEQPPSRASRLSTAPRSSPERTASPAAVSTQAGDRDVRKELREMREMLSVLTTETPTPGLSEDFMPYYRALLDRGIDRGVAARLVNTASKGMENTHEGVRVFRERMKMEVRRSLSATGGIALTAGKCHVVALVGPTGVGKTTNLAKLAAIFSVQERARVGVITADTYRVAATDQLRVFANIIDLDMKVVNDPGEMAVAMKSFKDYDLVLIDTAGGSPYNEDQISDIEEVLRVANTDETMLVLSASTPVEDLRGIVKQFSRLKPTSILFTKLDETRRCGPMYCLAAETGLPLSYFSIGQNVPDDVLLANVGTMANMVVEGGNQRGRSGTETT